MSMFLAGLIFVIVYIAMASEKLDKTVAVLFGAFFMFLFRLVPLDYALSAVDLNVIFLLVGMMTCVFVLSKTGFFEWVAISVAKIAKGKPLVIMLLFMVVTALLSSVLDNVTTIILIAPVTILIMEILEISPIPFLMLEVIASNIGGTATLIGDPPNIIIGSRAHISFNDFLFNLGPVVILVFAAFALTSFLIFRKKWQISESVKKRVTEAIPGLAIIDLKKMKRALAILGLIFLGFFTQGITGIEPGIIALSGSMLMLVSCGNKLDATFMRVEWSVIFFFIGLFILVSGLEYTGLIKVLAGLLINMAGNNLFLLCAIILCGSALFSSILDNIPFVITMIPMIKRVIEHFSSTAVGMDAAMINTHIAAPLWWCLALGACLGGNGTMIGASANVVMSKISDRNNHHISFFRFFKYGFPFMIQSILISLLYVWLRYF